MEKLLALNKLRWPIRLPVKWAVFALSGLIVCFPYPARLIRHVQHWKDPHRLIEPNAPALQPLVQELAPILREKHTPRKALKAVQRFVYKKIPYEWDWNTWGMADYLPTVTEAIEKGREDCDGQAVVAASLLAHFGYHAELVTDFVHVWVKTDQGELMGPGRRKAVVATDKGLIVQQGALTQVPRALAFGAAVFPLIRELILVVVMWFLFLRADASVWSRVLGLGLFLAGLFLLRAGGVTLGDPALFKQLAGLLAIVAGWIVMLRRSRCCSSRDEEAPCAG